MVILDRSCLGFTTLEGMVFPENLKKLSLSLNRFTTLAGEVFPENLEALLLNNNQLTTLEGVIFPENLKGLYISSNRLTTLEGVVFPKNLETLHLNDNNLITLEGVIFPENLKILFLGVNRFTTLEGVVFPENLDTLYMPNVPKKGSWAPYRIKTFRQSSIETFDTWFQQAMVNRDEYLYKINYCASIIQQWYRPILYRPEGPMFDKAFSSFTERANYKTDST